MLISQIHPGLNCSERCHSLNPQVSCQVSAVVGFISRALPSTCLRCNRAMAWAETRCSAREPSLLRSQISQRNSVCVARSCLQALTMISSFASAFKSDQFSDVDLVLLCNPNTAADSPCTSGPQQAANDKPADAHGQTQCGRTTPGAPAPHVLARFPAHSLLLCKCEYFAAQVRH